MMNKESCLNITTIWSTYFYPEIKINEVNYYVHRSVKQARSNGRMWLSGSRYIWEM